MWEEGAAGAGLKRVKTEESCTDSVCPRSALMLCQRMLQRRVTVERGTYA